VKSSSPIECISLSPLQAATLVFRDARGATVVTVVCKATFDLVPQEMRLAAQQEPIWDEDNHWDDDRSRSLYCPADIVPFKAHADVLLVGSAYAARGTTARSVVARLAVGALDKSIDVHLDRAVGADGSIQEGAPFAKLPLRYERSAGGPDTANPVGVPTATEGKIVLPNLELHGGSRSSNPRLEPVGFGPIAATWPERRARLGRRAGSWPVLGWEEMPLPVDVEPLYFNAAPRDQRLDAVRDDEQILLEHLHPEVERLVTRLPGLRPRSFLQRFAHSQREVPLAIDTLWIDTDRGIATVVWRGQAQIDDTRTRARVLVAMEGSARPATWEDIERRCRDLGIPTTIEAAEPSQIPPPPHTRARSPIPQGNFEETRAGLQLTLTDSERRALMESLQPQNEPLEARDPTEDTLVAKIRRPPTPRKTVEIAIVGSARTTAAPSTIETPTPADRRIAVPTTSTRSGRESQAPGMMRMMGVSPSSAPPTTENVALNAASPSLTPNARKAFATTSVSPTTPLPANAKLTLDSTLASSPEPRPTPQPPAQDPRGASRVPPPRRSSPGTSVAPKKPAPEPTREYLDLIWYDESTPARIRMSQAFSELLRLPEATRETNVEELVAGRAGSRDRRDVMNVVLRAKRIDGEGLPSLVADAVTEEGAFTPPLLVTAGGLHFPFDEVEVLRATTLALSPLAAKSEALATLLRDARELLQSPWALSARTLAESLTTRLDDVYAETDHEHPVGYLERTIERILLEERQYQRRTVFGGRHVRGLLVPSGATTAIPAYLPDRLASELPLFRSFKACLLAEACTQQDQHEEHPVALRVLALGRLVPVPGARSKS
jgi:hypothetical protein